MRKKSIVFFSLVLFLSGVFLFNFKPQKVWAGNNEKVDGNEKTVVSSIKIPSEQKQLAGLSKISLVDAINFALKNVKGNAIKAELDDEDGYLMYSVEVADNKNTIELKIDPSNGKVLKKEIQKDDEEENVKNNDENDDEEGNVKNNDDNDDEEHGQNNDDDDNDYHHERNHKSHSRHHWKNHRYDD